MTPIKSGKYEFSTESLAEIRKRLGLSQSEMAKRLGIPANTLSRWEIGATTPNAESLAEIYSVALEHGITPTFFRRRRLMPKLSQQPSRLLVMWDFQNLGVADSEIADVDAWIRDTLEKRLPATSHRIFKAFAYGTQSRATDKLADELGWRVWEDNNDLDEEIIDQCKSDCGQDPEDSILVLITKDRDYVDPVKELRSKGVTVYLIAPEDCSRKLLEAVGKKHWIRWTKPYIVSSPPSFGSPVHSKVIRLSQ